MIETQILKGNLIKQEHSLAFTLNQYDKNISYKINLIGLNGNSYTLDNEDIVTIEWLKPNGRPFLQSSNITKGDTYVTILIPEAVTQYAGAGSYNIIITNGGARKGTIKREYNVIGNSMRPGSVSEDVITDAITELRELSVEIADTVQNNQDLINNNQAATKQDIANVTSDLEDISYDFSSIKGDGTTDETLELQNIFNNLKECSKISFPHGKKIKITKPIEVKTHNIIIDGNNCEIVWDNRTNIINDTTERACWNGFFNIHGEETDIKTKITGYSTNIEPVKNGKWKVEDSSNFTINDYVYIEIKGGFEVTNYENSYNPSIMVLAKIVHVETGYITTDYYTPFYMDNFNWDDNCTITKVIPKNNIVIENFILNDIVPWTNYTSNDGTNRDKIACGIGLNYVNNIIIRNIKGYNNKFPLVMLNKVHNFNIEDIVMNDPAYVGPGEGYAVKLNKSCYGSVKNVYSKNGRHVLDCSWSAFADIENCYNVSKNYQQGGANTAFDLHGICEHNIKFYNCNGDFVFGNGFASFPMLMKDIIIDKCTCKGSFYNTENLLVQNSNITLHNGGENEESGHISVKFENCNIEYGRTYVFKSRKRGINLNTSLEIINCNIKEYIPGTGSEYVNLIENFDNVKIINSNIDFRKTSQILKLVNVQKFYLTNNKTQGFMIQFDTSSKNYLNYNIKDNDFEFSNDNLIVSDTSEVDIIRLLRMRNTDGVVLIDNNIIRTYQDRILTVLNTNIPDESPKTNNIKIFFENNKILPSKTGNTKLLLPCVTGVFVYSNNNYLDQKIEDYSTLTSQQMHYYQTTGDVTLGNNIRISRENALVLLENANKNGFQLRNTDNLFAFVSVLNGVFGENLFEIDRNGKYIRIKTKALKLPVSTTSDLPTAEKGAIFFDYQTNSFKKCIDGSTWVDANI